MAKATGNFYAKQVDRVVKKTTETLPLYGLKQFFNQRRLFAQLAVPAGTCGDAGFIRGGPDRKEA
jgi:hypothetical protein